MVRSLGCRELYRIVFFVGGSRITKLEDRGSAVCIGHVRRQAWPCPCYVWPPARLLSGDLIEVAQRGERRHRMPTKTLQLLVGFRPQRQCKQ